MKLTNFHRRSALLFAILSPFYLEEISQISPQFSCYAWRLTYGYLEIESHPATQNGFGNGLVSSAHFLNQIISNCMTPHGESRIQGVNTLRPRQHGRHFADDTFKCIFLNENVWMPIKFHWNLFLRVQLTIFHHWFRYWLGAVQATSHYLNQWWLVYRRIYASLGLNELSLDTYPLSHIFLNSYTCLWRVVLEYKWAAECNRPCYCHLILLTSRLFKWVLQFTPAAEIICRIIENVDTIR